MQKALASAHTLARSAGWLSQVPVPLSLFQHALRLAAFGQLHKVLGMDPLPSKMPKKPKNENPVDYTGKRAEGAWLGGLIESPQSARLDSQSHLSSSLLSVQIPPSTTYAITPMKRPMEEDGEEKSPSKKKKKIQKKGIGVRSWVFFTFCLLPVKVHPKVERCLLFNTLLLRGIFKSFFKLLSTTRV